MMNIVIIVTGSIVGIAYVTELFMAGIRVWNMNNMHFIIE